MVGTAPTEVALDDDEELVLGRERDRDARGVGPETGGGGGALSVGKVSASTLPVAADDDCERFFVLVEEVRRLCLLGPCPCEKGIGTGIGTA